MQNNRQVRIVLAFIAVLAIVALPVFASHALAFKPGEESEITKALLRDETQKGNEWMHNLYALCKGFVNIIAVVILLIAAFANILRINIETYSVKKILPSLIIALVLANIAMPIIAVLSKITDSMTAISIFKPLTLGHQSAYVFGGLWDSFKQIPESTPGMGIGVGSLVTLALSMAIGWHSRITIVYTIVFLVVTFTVLFLVSLVLAFRPYIIFLSAAISPIAIILSALPQTQQYFKKWLGILIPWLIMSLVVNFLLNIGNSISNAITSSAGGTATAGTGIISAIIGFALPSLVKLGLAFLALRFPFMIEKDISSVIGKLGNYAGKAAWIGIGSGVDAAYKLKESRKTKEAAKGVQDFEAVRAGKDDGTKKTRIKNEYLDSIKKIRAETVGKDPDSLTEEQKKYAVDDQTLERMANEYVEGKDLDPKIKERRAKEQAIYQELENEQKRIGKIPANLLTAEQAKLKNSTPNQLMQEARDKAQKEFEIEKRLAMGERAKEFGAIRGAKWEETSKGARAANQLMKWNPYGIAATLKERFETGEKERTKTYGKYSIIAEWARGKMLNTKYHQGIVKEDLSELGTAEQMMDYCRGSMRKFYANVRRSLEREGIKNLEDEEVREIGNRFLKAFRTDVKGTKDYLAHPYFEGMSDRESATIIEGDYHISRQIAIEMRRRDKPVEDMELEKRKLALISRGGSEAGPEQIVSNNPQADLVRRRTEELLLNIERGINRIPEKNEMSLVRLARNLPSQDLSGLNSEDFHSQNINVVIPKIEERAAQLKMNIDVKTMLQSGRSTDTGRLEEAMKTARIQDETMKNLLRDYTKNAVASIALAGNASSGAVTASTAKKIAQTKGPAPEDIGSAAGIVLTNPPTS